MTPRQRLAAYWWGLTERERAAIREQFIRKMQTDPIFLSQVRRVMARDKAEREKAKQSLAKVKPNDGEQVSSEDNKEA